MQRAGLVRFRSIPRVVWLSLMGLLIGSSALVPSVSAQGRSMPAPPAAPVQIYRPDLVTCQPDHLVTAFRRQLDQFASQPPQVMARLRQLQLELAEGTLRSCAEQNLISREVAERIWRDMQTMPLPQAPGSGEGQRP